MLQESGDVEDKTKPQNADSMPQQASAADEQIDQGLTRAQADAMFKEQVSMYLLQVHPWWPSLLPT